MTVALAAIPSIDYRGHPAFREFPGGPWTSADEVCIADRIKAIDEAFVSLRDDGTRSESEIDPLFEREIAMPARELGQFVAGRLADPRAGEWATRSIDGAFMQLRDQIHVANRARRLARQPRVVPQLAELGSQGCTEVGVPAGSSAWLFELAEPYRRQLLERSETRPGHVQWIAIPPHGRLGRSFLRTLASAGVDRLASDYRGVPMAVDHLALHYSHPGQTWFKDCYADVGLPTSPLAYLHYDKDTTSVKAIAYLAAGTDPVDGAFSYVVGSHRWPRSEFLFALRNHLDLVHQSLFVPPSASGYHRPRFVDRVSRERMLAMPAAFHGCSHFGCDLLADDPVTSALLQAERVFTNVDGCIVFDGGRGLHRGGMVSSRPRWALQIGFRPVDTMPLGRGVRRLAGRALRAVRQWRLP